MSDDALRTEVYDFLGRTFPGSTLDDGYYFVHIEAPVVRYVCREKAHEIVQALVDAPSWLVAVNSDPVEFVRATRIEKGTTDYNPDWNHSQPVPRWIAALPAGASFDLEGVRKSMKPLGALAIISPSHRVVFDIHQMRVHAATQADLERFVRGSAGWFEGDERTPSA